MSRQPERSWIGERVGRYVIRRELARGGMGVVFEAVHEGIGHRAAVKLLSAELSRDPKHQDYVDRFFGEARAVNIVQHPGVVQIFDFGQLEDGTVYILMEFLEGESLWDRLERLRERGGRMAAAEGLRVVRHIASALAAAHDKGIVHRDLKPENVVLVPDADGDRPKVLDFGIAKFLDSPHRMTTAGMVLGTAIYMSPEQCQGAEKLDDKADVYSLGVMLYELLAGAPPFEGEPARVMRAHVFQAPRPLPEACPGLPEAVYGLAQEMLAKEPAGRPVMAQVAARIQHIEEEGGLPAAPEPGAAAAAPTSRGGRGGYHRTHLVTARRMQGGVFLSWPVLVLLLLGMALLSLGSMWWTLMGTRRPAPAPAVVPPVPAPPSPPAAAPPAEPPAAAPAPPPPPPRDPPPARKRRHR